MRMSLLAAGFAAASLAASAAADASTMARPEVRSDTVIHVQGPPPPWAACSRWDRRRGLCLDPGWRSRRWRSWYGRRTCRFGHAWWIDNWGRWRRC